MTATNHVLTGAAIALVVKRPELAIPLAFLSHFVTDMIPHSGGEGERAGKQIATIDAVAATLLTLIVSAAATQVSFWVVSLSALAAISPDLAWVWRYYRLGSIEKAVNPPRSSPWYFHKVIQWSETRKGFVVELAWFLLVTYVIWHNL